MLNVAGYYDALLKFLAHSEAEGFMSAEQTGLLQVGQDPRGLLQTLADRVAGADHPDDYRRI